MAWDSPGQTMSMWVLKKVFSSLVVWYNGKKEVQDLVESKINMGFYPSSLSLDLWSAQVT